MRDFCTFLPLLLLLLLRPVLTPAAARSLITPIPDTLLDNETSFIRSGSCQFPWMYPYQPQELTSVGKLPDSIQARLRAALIERVGEKFYRTMAFSSGQRVEFQKLYTVDPSARNFRWTVAAYYLCFSCPQLLDAQGPYRVGIKLDSAGVLLQAIDLPFIAKDSTTATIMSASKAATLAQRKGIKRVKGQLVYSPRLEILVWQFFQSTRIRPGLRREHKLYLNANSGEVLSNKKYRYRFAPF